eukprot:CAMPEP_0181446890 /NCGR_PEP_ID=MMETSP1110-20121109/26341_1 /TAXON_ID=174948 /ORGANISM="Symbiodinium sp., Strain CCMP421" /LENGTH=80 /DNA_ID=CAMNT_0023570989 /DNA_START=64 /DNA_END=303 /DNA_ORIENTATION=-
MGLVQSVLATLRRCMPKHAGRRMRGPRATAEPCFGSRQIWTHRSAWALTRPVPSTPEHWQHNPSSGSNFSRLLGFLSHKN